MSSEEDFPQTGIIAPRDQDRSDSMNNLAHAILDDVLYNLIHDIVLRTHREEKIARASTAAIVVEQLATEIQEEEPVEPATPTTPKKKRKLVHTTGATYDDGSVYVVGNPLETTKEIRCPKCGLPRLLSPEIGPDTRQPDPSTEYCKRRPYIDKPGHDIYGQPLGISTRLKATRKPKGKNLSTNKDLPAEAASSFDSPGPSPPPEAAEEKQQKLVLPKVKCPECKMDFPVNRFARHLFSCRKFGGRASGRAAALKINEQQNGSQHSSTPPRSRKSTPLPPDKKSPNKRDVDDLGEDEDDYDGESPKKKKPKKVVTKKWKSGKVTVNGKAVGSGLGLVDNSMEGKPALKVKAKDQKLIIEAALGLEPREVSESSQTLSSP